MIGMTFDEVMRACEFDRRLCLLMFDAVARIEVFLRSRLAYFAAKESGAFGYPEGEVLDFVGKVPGLVAEPGDLGTA